MSELLKKRGIFDQNIKDSTDLKKIIQGQSSSLNDFNNLKYNWTTEFYRNALNNFWIPEEINLNQDVKDYRKLDQYEKHAFDRCISFLTYLDSIQSAYLPYMQNFITAPEVNMCLSIQNFQEQVHSQSYSYILDSIASGEERDRILYLYKEDEFLLKRNRFVGDQYNDLVAHNDERSFMKALVASYILEGIYFFYGFSFFYNLSRIGKMPGTVQEIRYINRDEDTHLFVFRNMINELRHERPDLFTEEHKDYYRSILKAGVESEIEWGRYSVGDNIQGLNTKMIDSYIYYLGNLRSTEIGMGYLFDHDQTEPQSMKWVAEYSDPNNVKSDFFEAKVTAYSKSSVFEDDL